VVGILGADATLTASEIGETVIGEAPAAAPAAVETPTETQGEPQAELQAEPPAEETKP
jgi:hypothetical protein